MKRAHNELQTLYIEGQWWGWLLLGLGTIVAVMIVWYAAGVPSISILTALTFLLSIAAIGAGIARLGDAGKVRAIIKTIEERQHARR